MVNTIHRRTRARVLVQETKNGVVIKDYVANRMVATTYSNGECLEASMKHNHIRVPVYPCCPVPKKLNLAYDWCLNLDVADFEAVRLKTAAQADKQREVHRGKHPIPPSKHTSNVLTYSGTEKELRNSLGGVTTGIAKNTKKTVKKRFSIYKTQTPDIWVWSHFPIHHVLVTALSLTYYGDMQIERSPPYRRSMIPY